MTQFSSKFNRLFFSLIIAMSAIGSTPAIEASERLQVGMAERDITPPEGFPMAGYYHERLAEGTIDPLKAKAIVFRQGSKKGALVVCDLTGVTVDLAHEVRSRAAKRTGIAYENIVVAATHSHTAPDYYASLNSVLDGDRSNAKRSAYVEKLIEESAATVVAANESAGEATLLTGSATQETPVAFNRRFVMRDGSVRTWMSFQNPETIKSAGPIDPEIGLLAVRNSAGEPIGLLSNFALHLDTVGGMKWSGDYPYFIEETVRQTLGPKVISLFGTGCCGDINHSNPRASARNKTDFIGKSLGTTIRNALPKLQPVTNDRLSIHRAVVNLPLQDITADDVKKSIDVIKAVAAGEKIDFFEHVKAHKVLMVDQLRNAPPLASAISSEKPFLRSHKWAGVGDTLPVEVHAIAIGEDVAIVTLPGEIFVDLGLAIKQASPFEQTIVVELANAVETIYVPTRAAHAGGSYEVLNSTVKPGSGEMLVEESLKLLRAARQELGTPGK